MPFIRFRRSCWIYLVRSIRKKKVVTFLGRITMQKGPEYFVEAAALVLKRSRNIRFVMAGSGDMLNAMINLAAERGIADRFHFPGFQRGRQVYEAYKNSDVFVMPSVSGAIRYCSVGSDAVRNTFYYLKAVRMR